MAERRASNKYYPPDWDPSKGSINKHNKSHPLRARARKIDQGILVIRFEMPFNIWCLDCNKHIAMGVRFNAEKSKVGFYYSTPIYSFKMKCHLCDNHFEIQTDPAKLDYAIISGARRQQKMSAHNDDTQGGPIGGANQMLQDQEGAKRRLTDAMYRLEKKVESRINFEASLPGIQEMIEWRSRRADSFSANQIVRSQYRKKRKEIEHKWIQDKKLLKKLSLTMSLEPASTRDFEEAKRLSMKSSSKNSDLREKLHLRELLSGDIFAQTSSNKLTLATGPGPRSQSHIESANELNCEKQSASCCTLKELQTAKGSSYVDSSTIKREKT